MRYWRAGFIFLLSSVLLWSCESKSNSDTESTDILVIPDGFPDITFPEGNEFTKARWDLGKKLFYDPILSIDSSISCASCHKAHLAFADDQALSPGVQNRPGVRNAPSLANIAYHPYFLREGSVPTLEMQALVPIQEENEFDHDILVIAELLKNDPEYISMSKQAYERAPDPYVIVRALANFQRTLISGNSSYDKFHFQGQNSALSESARRGMDLFFSSKTSCGNCHGGFNFTDYSFQNNGLDSIYDDPGRRRLTGKPEDEALFKVPSLRNVALTAPYMHDGRFATLMEVVEHYDSGGANHPNKSALLKPLQLSSTEIQDLMAFLESLTDEEFVSNPLFAF